MLDQSIISDQELQKLGYEPTLHRTLTTRQLTSFGLTYLQPMGAAVVFGFLLTTSGGSVALPYLFAFIGMIFTVLSYSVLIKEYPLAGSIYNYVKYISGDFWGFIAGWLLALDYILIPTITSICAATYAHQLIPIVSYESWLITFVLAMGLLNLIGIKSTSLFSDIMLFVQIMIVLVSLAIWTYFLVNHHGFGSLFSVKPFHFKSLTDVIQASSIAIFGFLGFDAITTLAEEAINPRKDIPKAMMLCTCIGFVFMFITGYLGVLLVPNWKVLASDQNWVNATLFYLAKMTGGELFGLIYTIGFIAAMMVTNLVGTTSAVRLLYAMGRDEKIPKHLFGAINTKFKTPHGSIIFLILTELILGSFVNQDSLAELINYGAISAFIILNISVVSFGYRIFKNKDAFYKKSISNKTLIFRFFIFPIIAAALMIAIFANMKAVTLAFGTLWMIIGSCYFFYLKPKSLRTR